MLCSSPRAYIGPAQHLTPRRPSAGTFPVNDSLESVIRAFMAYRYSVLFVGLTLENAVFLGFIVPGITILIIAGYLIAAGGLDPALAFTAGYCGTLLGDNINYLVGRFCAGRIRIIDAVLAKTPEVRAFLHDRPRWQFLFFHFPLYLRTVFLLTLGAAVFPARAWIAVDCPAAKRSTDAGPTHDSSPLASSA